MSRDLILNGRTFGLPVRGFTISILPTASIATPFRLTQSTGPELP
jgi:hypothetical protein